MEFNSKGKCSSRSSVTSSNFENTLLSVEEIEGRVQQLITENTELRNTLQQNNTYMKQLTATLAEWQDDVVQVQSVYHNKVEKAKEVITKLKSENALLKQQMAAKNSFTNHVSSNIRPDQVQEGFESLDSYVFVATASNNNHTNPEADQLPSYDSLFIRDQGKVNKEIQEDTEISLSRVQREADFLREQLAREMESNKNKQSLLIKTQDQLDQLMIEFQDLSKKWGQQSQIAEGPTFETELEELSKINLQMRKNYSELEEKVASVNSRLATAEEMVLSKQVTVTELQSEVSRLEKCLETMPILKAQMELFRTDFEAEREARQSLAGEKDAIEQELRLLKRQLEGRSVENSYVSVSTPPTGLSEDTTALAKYECPKCNFSFTNNDALNNHLDVCLTQHMFP